MAYEPKTGTFVNNYEPKTGKLVTGPSRDLLTPTLPAPKPQDLAVQAESFLERSPITGPSRGAIDIPVPRAQASEAFRQAGLDQGPAQATFSPEVLAAQPAPVTPQTVPAPGAIEAFTQAGLEQRPAQEAFRVDPGHSGDEYVDLIVVDTNGGFTAFVENFDRYSHRIVIDQRPNIQHHGMIWYSDMTTAEIDTGIDFLYDTNVSTMWAEVVNVVASGTVDVGVLSSGTNGDANGFLDGVLLTTAGHVLTTLTYSGALMDDGSDFDPDGHTILSANEQSLTYTTNSDTDTAEAGYIHWLMTRVR